MTRSIRKDSSSQDSQSKENVSVLPQAIKCILWHLKKTTIIVEGTVYKSDGKIMLHNKALPKDCYKVSIDKSLVDAAFIPDVGSNGCTTVLDAVGGFVAWPKNQVVFDPKATPPSTIQMITVENKTAPKVPTKRKNFYVSSDAMQKEANKKRSQKALVTLQAPPSLDYIPGPEEPQSPPPPDFVPKFMPPEDEILLAEEQPLPAADLPTTQSPDYVPESNPKADLEEDDNENPEEDLVNYPANRGDEGDDEDESSEDDEDDDVDIKADDDEEDEHPAPADSIAVALLAADQAPSAEETEPFETDESAATPPPYPAYRVIARISILALAPTSVWSDAEVASLLAISTPPSSPLSPWSSPMPQIPSPLLPPILSPLPVSPPLHVSSPPPTSLIRSLSYRAVMIWLRVEAPSNSDSLLLPSTYHLIPPSGTPSPLPIPALTSSPPLLLPSTNRREDRLEVTLSPRKRLGISLGPTYKVRESSSAAAARPAGGLKVDYGFVTTMDREIIRDLERDVGYGITDSWDKIDEAMQGAPASNDTELSQRMTEFETRVRQDTYEIYTRLDDEQTE
ncbi:hypothetical protein Tco_0932458 [Tanacetum coccineum]